MSQLIQFLDLGAAAQCRGAVAPIVEQGAAAFAADGSGDSTGSTPVVIEDLAAGAAAFNGGQVINRGCFDLLVELGYLAGDDCDPCTTPDSLSLVPISLVVPANASMPLPSGFWQDLQVTLVDSSGAPVDLVGDATQTVLTYSAFTPDCPSCVVSAI